MKRVYSMAALLLLPVFCTCSTDSVSKRAEKAMKSDEHYIIPLSEEYQLEYAKSFFDIKSDVIEQALKPDASGVRDLRPLQTAQCRAAMATMSFRLRHRGSIGLVAGLVIGAAATYFGRDFFDAKDSSAD